MTADRMNHSQELYNLQYLAKCSQSNLPNYIVKLLDDFIHQGPNGTHQCLVFELLGPTINFIVAAIYDPGGSPDGGDSLEPEDILRLSKQLLQALAFIHKAGYAHGGTAAYRDFIRSSRLRLIHFAHFTPATVADL
jgi:serine/threonine-protein kinase SRPK3